MQRQKRATQSSKLSLPKQSKAAVKLTLFSAAGVMAIASVIQFGHPSFADTYDDQISAIQSQIDGYNAQAANLKAQADTLQNAIAELNAQKAVIQGQIDLSQAQHDKLVADIATTQKKIEATQAILASTVADMYVDSKTTTLEMVASSNNISDYVNAQQYNDVASQQVQSSIKQIKSLKTDLQNQQTQVDLVLANQQAQRATLQQKTDEQNTLLAQTQGNEAAYQSLIGQSNASIASLKAQQQAANAAAARRYGATVTAGDPSHHGYPDSWANAVQDTVVDSWGMYNRECVSYVAWRVDQAYHNMPYWGNIPADAKYWPSNARAAGFRTGSSPKVGSAAVMTNGTYGHVAWVESVNSDGTITVSQYNWVHGQYSEMTISSSAFDTYIYFGG